jgi:hypothetical protein
MFPLIRQSDTVRRRSLLAISLTVSSWTVSSWTVGAVAISSLTTSPGAIAGDGPDNGLRISSPPAIVSVVTAGEQSREQGEAQNQIATAENSVGDGAGEISLVSDGWNARAAIDPSLPLVDPIEPKTSYTIAPDQPKAVKLTPRSTLKFVVPETRYAQPIASDSPSSEQSQSQKKSEPAAKATPSVSLHALYGPGEPMEPVLELLPAIDSDVQAMPVSNPEENEPKISVNESKAEEPSIEPSEEPIGGSVADSSVADSSLESPDEPIESMDVAVEDERDRSVSDIDRQRIKVRDLILDVDDLSDPPSLSKVTKANPVSSPVSSPNADRQTVGDVSVGDVSVGDVSVGEVGTESTENRSADRIGPNGDLIFALGMSQSKIAVTPTATRLRVPIERTLNYYWSRPENSRERTHWGMFHAMMVYDKDTQIIDGKRRYNAVAWMAGNNPCRNDLLFEEDKQGINVKSGIGLQGHQAQMLAVFGLIDVPAAYPLYVNRKKFTVEDVIKREMDACKSGNELSFTLIGLAHYIDSDSRWVASDGQDWDFEKLIKEELAQPIVGAACGGTHRLMGFAHALRRRRAEGKPMTGQWLRAETYINDFITYTWQLQNRDGSMSTAWFEGAEDNGKIDRKIQTTGHMVEFLLTTVSDDQLQSPQMIRAVNFLTTTLYEERGHEWSIGPKGHALRALAMYYQRVFGRQDPWRPLSVARTGSTHSR